MIEDNREDIVETEGIEVTGEIEGIDKGGNMLRKNNQL